MNRNSKNTGETGKPNSPESPLKRRAFLQYSGAGLAASAFVLGGCGEMTQEPSNLNRTNSIIKNGNGTARVGEDGTVYLGSGDVGILNYAYALEQLEASVFRISIHAI